MAVPVLRSPASTAGGLAAELTSSGSYPSDGFNQNHDPGHDDEPRPRPRPRPRPHLDDPMDTTPSQSGPDHDVAATWCVANGSHGLVLSDSSSIGRGRGRDPGRDHYPGHDYGPDHGPESAACGHGPGRDPGHDPGHGPGHDPDRDHRPRPQDPGPGHDRCGECDIRYGSGQLPPGQVRAADLVTRDGGRGTLATSPRLAPSSDRQDHPGKRQG